MALGFHLRPFNQKTRYNSQMTFDSSNFIKSQTRRPGVYQMFDADQQILYVGKARNLKNRLATYFHSSGVNRKTAALVSRIDSIDVTITETETEALILEHNLIKQYRPPFNILMRDDKSYPYIFLSDGDAWPRLSFHRGAKKKKGTYFGPFPNASAVRESLSFLQKTFLVRQCEDSFFKNRSRPCLQYQIERCRAPCVGLVSESDYSHDVNLTQLYLEGNEKKLLKHLETDMDRKSEALEFESAAKIRDQIAAIRTVQSEQVIEKGRGHTDVVAAAFSSGEGCIHILFVRQGRILGSKSYYPKARIAQNASDLLSDFLPLIYLDGQGRPDMPNEILINIEIADASLLSAAIRQHVGRKVAIRSSVRGFRAKWLELAETTAEQNLSAKLTSSKTTTERFESLRKTLNWSTKPQRIECFDVSHSSGEATVASCVVFDESGASKSNYRRFNIDNVVAGDDYAALGQAVKRRFARLKNGEGILPDVLLIDGGVGQVSVVKDTLSDLDIKTVEIIGVSKGTSRKAGMETIILGNHENREIFEPEKPALHLIQQIRDEAHRFAVSGHRQRRDKKRQISLLQGIPGVGPARRRELIKYFGGAKEVRKASISDLMKVPNINKKVAEAIYTALYKN